MSGRVSSALLAPRAPRPARRTLYRGGLAAVVLLAVLLAGGCDRSGPTEPAIAGGTRYLFEAEFQNHAWSPPGRWLGLVVEADGGVYQYDRSGETPRMCDHYWHWLIADECRGKVVSEAELQRRYTAGRSFLTQISPAALDLRRGQTSRVSDGPFDIPNRACNDHGVLSLVAFRSDSGLYTPAVLRLEGDQIRQNLSQGAVELTPWLLELAERMPALAAWRNSSADCRPD